VLSQQGGSVEQLAGLQFPFHDTHELPLFGFIKAAQRKLFF
jgi:hypothetical protein